MSFVFMYIQAFLVNKHSMFVLSNTLMACYDIFCQIDVVKMN